MRAVYMALSAANIGLLPMAVGSSRHSDSSPNTQRSILEDLSTPVPITGWFLAAALVYIGLMTLGILRIFGKI